MNNIPPVQVEVKKESEPYSYLVIDKSVQVNDLVLFFGQLSTMTTMQLTYATFVRVMTHKHRLRPYSADLHIGHGGKANKSGTNIACRLSRTLR